MKLVVILRGPSGVGKTWHARRKFNEAAYCSADLFFEGTTDGKMTPGYDFDPRKLPEAHQRCMAKFLDAIKGGAEQIVVDNTNTRKWEYINYVKIAELMGYDVEIYECLPMTVVTLIEIAKRNVHEVPFEIIARQVERFEPDPHASHLPVD